MGRPVPQILIIDDSKDTLLLLEEFLERKGIEVTTCQSAQEGLAILRRHDIKLVLVDIVMPEMNGVNLLKRVLEINPSVDVVMMTGVAEMSLARECLELGAKDFIKKPFDLEYLETSVFAEVIQKY